MLIENIKSKASINTIHFYYEDYVRGQQRYTGGFCTMLHTQSLGLTCDCNESFIVIYNPKVHGHTTKIQLKVIK